MTATATEQTELDEERERMERIAALTDPATIRYLEKIGVQRGWQCAEVGAGAGSIVRWLSDHVGQFGKVVAVDINTAYMGDLAAPNIEIREQDIVQTPLEPFTYDLIHVKILLMHLPERDQVLRQLVSALKPGGYLLVEEADVRSMQRTEPPSPLLTRAMTAMESFFYFAGADPAYATRLLPAVKEAGLEVLGTDCQVTAVQAGTPEVKTISLSMAKLAPIVVQVGLMDGKEVDQVFELLERPSDLVLYTPLTVSVWGQRAH